MSLAYQHVEARRTPRDDVDYHCQARLVSGQAHAHIVNISPLGCMIRCAAAAAADEAVTLRLPLLGVTPGRVVWAKLDRMGIEFAQAMEAEIYARMLAQLNPQSAPGARG